MLYKSRIRTFQEFLEHADFFFEEQIKFDPKAVEKYLKEEKTKYYLEELQKSFQSEGDFSNLEVLESLLRTAATKFEVDARDLIHPLRVVISGRSVTPGLFEVMSLLGKEVVLKRIQYAIIHFKKLADSNQE